MDTRTADSPPGLEALLRPGRAASTPSMTADVEAITKAYRRAREDEQEAKRTSGRLLREGAKVLMAHGLSKSAISRQLGVSRQRLHEVLTFERDRTAA